MTVLQFTLEGAAMRYETSSVQAESGMAGGALDGLLLLQPHYPPFFFERLSVRELVSNARSDRLPSPRKETA